MRTVHCTTRHTVEVTRPVSYGPFARDLQPLALFLQAKQCTNNARDKRDKDATKVSLLVIDPACWSLGMQLLIFCGTNTSQESKKCPFWHKQQRNQEKTNKQTLHLLLLPEANGWQPVLCFPHTLGGLRALPERLATLPRKLSQITSFANHYNQYRERSSIYNNTK